MITLNNTAFGVVFSPCKQITSVAFLVSCVLGTADSESVPQQDMVVLQWLYFWCTGVFLLIFRKSHQAQILGQEADAKSWSSICRRHNDLYLELHILSIYYHFFSKENKNLDYNTVSIILVGSALGLLCYWGKWQ